MKKQGYHGMKHINSGISLPFWMKFFIEQEHGIICANMRDGPMFFRILKINANGVSDIVDFRPGRIEGATNGNRPGITE
ncbi:MAG: hypothetical protein WB792_00085 [Desulfobacterales bacterium]